MINKKYDNYLIKDISKINSDNYSNKDNWNYILYLDTKNITKNSIDNIKKYSNDDKIPSRAKRIVKKNDIIISTVRPKQEHYGILRSLPNNLLVSTGFTVISPNENMVDPDYLYYYLTQKNIINFLQNIAEQSTTSYPSIKSKDIENIKIFLPSLKNQRQMAYILRKIDEKIENIKKINQNLESQVLTIFRSWFLEFNLSNEFKESSIGFIPKYWSVDYLGSGKSCSIIDSGINEFNDQKIYIATADVDGTIITNNETLIKKENKPSRANMQPVEKSIWFAKMIDSRKLIMVDDYCNDILDNYIFSTGFCGLKCAEIYFYYLWSFLLTKEFDVMKNNFCTGTTMQSINNKDIKKIEIVLPSNEILLKFNNIVRPIFKKIYYNNLENEKLKKSRDILLPKLIFGELNVSNIEI